jgi:hypothetical protein
MNWHPVEEWTTLLAGLTANEQLEFGREDHARTFCNSFDQKEHNEYGLKIDPLTFQLSGWSGTATRVRVREFEDTLPIGLADPMYRHG